MRQKSKKNQAGEQEHDRAPHPRTAEVGDQRGGKTKCYELE
jgi:hypothetical protein